MTIDEYLKEQAQYPRQPFQPCFYYNRDGDMIECYLKEVFHVCETLTRDITLCRCPETGEVVGVKLFGVKQRIERGEGGDVE